MNSRKLKFIVLTAILAAMSTVIYYYLPEIPIIPGVEYLKIDLSDLPALIAAFVLGPFSAILVEFIKNLIHLMKTSTLGIGEICNFLVGVSLIVPFGIIFKKLRKKNKNKYFSYLISSIISIISIIVFGLLVNFAFVPLYFKLFNIPFNNNAYIGFVLSSIPLNIVKGIINSLLALPILIALEKNKIISD